MGGARYQKPRNETTLDTLRGTSGVENGTVSEGGGLVDLGVRADIRLVLRPLRLAGLDILGFLLQNLPEGNRERSEVRRAGIGVLDGVFGAWSVGRC